MMCKCFYERRTTASYISVATLAVRECERHHNNIIMSYFCVSNSRQDVFINIWSIFLISVSACGRRYQIPLDGPEKLLSRDSDSCRKWTSLRNIFLSRREPYRLMGDLKAQNELIQFEVSFFVIYFKNMLHCQLAGTIKIICLLNAVKSFQILQIKILYQYLRKFASLK